MWRLIFVSLMAVVRFTARSPVFVSRFGRIAFRGLIGNRHLTQLGHQEIRNALVKVGMREAHNAHFVKRLIERGPQWGINSLNEFARVINAGVARVGTKVGTTEIVFSEGSKTIAIVLNSAGELITLTRVR